ncbi:thioredoxin-dependent thiol peroxidase [soil metagenome]
MEARPPTIPAAGDPAPPLALPGDDGLTHDLANRRGHWTVVYFYPKDDTPGCTTEACEFRDAHSEMLTRAAEVWGVSVLDTSSKAAFRSKYDLPFVLLADEDHRVAEAWGVWVEKRNYGKTYMGIQRSTFLVGPDGHVARAWPKVNPAGHAADVVAALDEIRDSAAAP